MLPNWLIDLCHVLAQSCSVQRASMSESQQSVSLFYRGFTSTMSPFLLGFTQTG